MKKKVICIALALLMCMMVTLTSVTDGSTEDMPTERASIVASFGLKHISGSTYKMWAKIHNPSAANVTATLSLYDATYSYITSVSTTSSSTTINLSKNVSLSSGIYYVRLSYTVDGSSYSSERAYNI